MAPTVLWIGLGNMGRGMCKNIVDKGQLQIPLLVYNRSVQRAHALRASLPAGKTEVVEDVAAASDRAEVIFSCVANDDAVQALYATLLAGDVKGKLFIECSTIHPESSEAIGQKVVAAGAEFVSAPVFGAPAMADAGQLIAVLAGPKPSVDRAKPWFTGVTSRAEIDMGGQPWGKSLALKVIGNTFVFNMVEQLAEAHVLAEKSGLGTDVLHTFVEHMFPGPYTAYSTRMLTGDYHTRKEPLFAVDLARKDIRHANALARNAGVRLGNLAVADAHLDQVKRHCGDTGDIAGIYGAARKEAGLSFEN